MFGGSEFDADHNPRTVRYLPLSYHFGAPARSSHRAQYLVGGAIVALCAVGYWILQLSVLHS